MGTIKKNGEKNMIDNNTVKGDSYVIEPPQILPEDLETWSTYREYIISTEETKKKIKNSDTVIKKAEALIKTYNSLSLLSGKDTTFSCWFEQYGGIIRELHSLYRDAIDEDSYVSHMSEERIKNIIEGKHEKILQQLLYTFIEITREDKDLEDEAYKRKKRSKNV